MAIDSENTKPIKNINLEDVSLKDDINFSELLGFIKEEKNL